MQEVASLSYGVIFKKAFSEPEIFKGFVRDILGIKMEIEKVETEKSFTDPVGKINLRYDLFAEDKKQRIIVDIQHVRYADHYHRFLHYHCAALLEQADKFLEYRPERTVYTIVVLTSGDRHRVDVSLIDFDPKTLEGRSLKEIEHKIVYLCPKYVNDKTPLLYREWLRAIDDSLDGQVDETSYLVPEIRRVFEIIKKDLLSPVERERIMDEYRHTTYVNEQFTAGLQKGLQDGIKKGIVQTALIMLNKGININLIAEITGLSIADINNLTSLSQDDKK